MLGLIKRFLLLCSGASSSVLMKPECEIEHTKYANIGALILITSVLAALTGAYAFYVSLRSILVSIVAGFLWGAFVLAFDRFLAASAKKELEPRNSKLERFGRACLHIVPRLVLMVFIGIVIVVPFELRLLQREIDAQIVVKRTSMLAKIRDEIRQQYPEIDQLNFRNEQLEREVAVKQAERDRLLGLSVDELSGKARGGTTAMDGVGPVYRQRRKAFEAIDKDLDDLRSRNDRAIAENRERLMILNNVVATQQEQATKSMNASDGLLARVEALMTLVNERRIVATIHYVLILLFVLLASGPILVIALTSAGPYDYISQAIDRDIYEKQSRKVTNVPSAATITTDTDNEAPGITNEPPSPSTINRDPYKLVGTKFSSKYLLEEYAGGGGMGAVYRAVDQASRTKVAVKILKPDVVLRNSRNAVSFQREVAAARTLEHPNIVRVLDAGVSNDISFMVMEWLDGRTLEDVLEENQLEMPRVVDLFGQICNALMAAHAKNIIHLDIKPANVFVLPNQPWHIKVIDFGMARVLSNETGTTVTRFLGTYQYCSPEHFGGKVTYRSDIYSLGATLYHMIAGVIPFGTSYINAKMHPDMELPPVPSIINMRSEVPMEVDAVIRKALSKRPGERQQSVRELLDDFYLAMRGVSQSSKVSIVLH
jgi:hypothetical protein